MTGLRLGSDPALKPARPGPFVRLALAPWFHRLSARIPGLSHFARSEGQALFAIVAGFVRSQALLALVELRILHRLADGPEDGASLARAAGLPPQRMDILLQAGAALKLLKRRGDTWHLTTRGAAFLAVPGLQDMVRHHPVLYRDLADPVAFFRGDTSPELARFWPYVFGAGGAADPALAGRYSRLMADSQALVAADTLRLVSLSGVRHLMDVGGGTGAFLAAVRARYPRLALTLFDLPAVVAGAKVGQGTRIVPGSFRDDPLPGGADAISLIRVLYDHSDATVAQLLTTVREALPSRGRLIISEPMSGGSRPDIDTDVYFAVYTLAMQTGRTRSTAEIAQLCRTAGFDTIRALPGHRRFVTSIVTAETA